MDDRSWKYYESSECCIYKIFLKMLKILLILCFLIQRIFNEGEIRYPCASA
jgi:hypothetical protein